MCKYYSFIKNWFIISIATCVFSYILWLLIDFETFMSIGGTIEDLCFDITYCSIYKLFLLIFLYVSVERVQNQHTHSRAA